MIRVNGVRINFLQQNFSNLDAQLTRATLDAKKRALYGQDLFMFALGDIFPNNEQNRDLRTITGVYNYAQAITHRLMTTRGTHPEDPTFGVPWDLYLGRSYADSREVIKSLERDIADEVYKDHRTDRVLQISVTTEGPNVFSVACTVMPIGEGAQLEIGFNVGDF